MFFYCGQGTLAQSNAFSNHIEANMIHNGSGTFLTRNTGHENVFISIVLVQFLDEAISHMILG